MEESHGRSDPPDEAELPDADELPDESVLSDPEAIPDEAELTRRQKEYWRRNVRYVLVLLSVWFVVSYGAGILFVEPLNQLRIPGTGFPVGFWFAQQGSIYVFVALIFVYVWLMNRLDRRFDVHEGEDSA